MPGAGCDEKSDVESARAPVSRQKSEKQRRAPSVPQNSAGSGVKRLGALGRWQGRQGLQFFTEEASGGLANGKGRGRTAPVRRRTLPVC